MLQRLESLLRAEPYSMMALAVFLLFFGTFLYAKTDSKVGILLMVLGVVLVFFILEVNRVINVL